MELSVRRPIFCVHKGSIVHRFSIEPLCWRQLLLVLQIALAQKSYVPTLSQIQSYSVHKGSIYIYLQIFWDRAFVHEILQSIEIRCFSAQSFYLQIFVRITIVSLN